MFGSSIGTKATGESLATGGRRWLLLNKPISNKCVFTESAPACDKGQTWVLLTTDSIKTFLTLATGDIIMSL